MRVLKYLIALWVAIGVYATFSLLSGAVGISAYDDLRQERDRQLENLESLRQMNLALEGDKDALLYDSDTIITHARELGYGKADERFIRIVGLSGVRKQRFSAGRVVTAQKPEFVPDSAIRLIALSAGLAVLGFLFFVEAMVGRRPGP
jgi:cell division protein FtsB